MYWEVKIRSYSKDLENYFSSLNSNKIKKKKHKIFIFRGFKAVRKHRENILLLVKMMFSSYGDTLPCFKGG